MVSRKRFDAPTAAATFTASQRPRRDARLLHDGGHGAGVLVADVKLDCTSGVDKEKAQSSCAPIPIRVSTSVYNRIDDSIPQVWIDCELGRVAICRHELPEFRVWNYGHVAANGSGRILRSQLYTSCIQLGLVTNRSTFNGIIARGNRLYWRERDGYLYLTSWRKLSARLTRWQAKYAPDTVTTNRPGQRRVQLDLTGSLKLAHALIYNGWIAVKSEKLGYLDVSRFVLTRLWNRTTKTLLQWQKLVGIRVEHRYAEHHNIHSSLIPAHATLCLDKDGTEYASWRLSNRYYPASIQISQTNGQRRKVRAACSKAIESVPPVFRAGGQHRVQRIGRINFSDKTGKQGIVTAHKQLNRHLKKHNDILDRPHYAFMIQRYGKHIYEMSDGTPVRRATAERDRAGEQDAVFVTRRIQYRIGWISRCV